MDKTFLISQLKNDLRTYDNVQKITVVQEDDYIIGCLPDCPYFKENYKLIATDADPKAMQQIYLLGNLEIEGNANQTMCFVTEEAKETVLDFSRGTPRSYFAFMKYQYKITKYNTLNVKLSNSQLN